jgi:hypothetical protein
MTILAENASLLADGLEEGLIGWTYNQGNVIAIYDYDKCVQALMKDMTEEEAYEWMEYNVVGSYMGEKTPLFIHLA